MFSSPPDRQSQLLSFFVSAVRQRGADYARRGLVADLTRTEMPEGFSLDAKVQGSEVAPYRVTVSVRTTAKGGMRVEDTVCSCPMSFACKHAAAVICKAFAPSPSFVPQTVTPSRVQSLEEMALDHWIRSLGPATTDQTAPPPSPKRLEFHLRLGKDEVKVEILYHGADGAPVKLNTYSLSSLRHSLTLEDLGLIQLLSTGYNLSIPNTHGGDIMEAILKTGRAFLKNKRVLLPLLRGEARKAQLTWTTDDEGRQRSQVQIEPNLVLLPFDTLWYANTSSGICGPLEAGVAPEVVRAFLRAPAIPPELTEKADTYLRVQFPNLPLPPLQKIEIERIENVRPIPHLFVYETDNPNAFYHDDRSQRINVAKLEYIYAGHSVPDSNPNPRFVIRKADKVIEIYRDHQAESKALNFLVKNGFSKTSTLLFGGWNSALSNTWSLGLQREDWLDFVTWDAAGFTEAGWHITFDESFRTRLIHAESWYSDADEKANDWFSVELGVMIEGKKVNLLPILQSYLARNPQALSKEGLADLSKMESVAVDLPDGRLLAVPTDRLKSIVGFLMELFGGEKLDRRGRLKLNRLRAAELPALQDGQWNWLGSAELRELGAKLRNFKGIAHVAPSPQLQTTLRPYQQEGLNWLQFLREYDLGGALADDMGLGKTIQALAHLLAEKESGRMDRPSLVIAPTSLMTNWRQEAQKFAPSLKTLVLHGLDRRNDFERIRDHDLVVTSYALLPRDEAVLLEHDFHCVILDEAQYIKNPKTRYAQVASALKARHRLCLTGTPMENHLGELWSLFNFALPGFLGDETRFRQAFRNPIEKHNDDARRKVLAHRISPFVLRRKKEDVATELPPKTEIVQNAELEGAQRDLYETIRLAMHSRVLAEVNKKGMSRSHIIILDALLKLRQVCCDPRLLPSTIGKNVKQSAKLQLLMDLVPEMVSEGRRILLFSQFTSMLALIQGELDLQNIPYVLLTGETTDRATPINRFQNGEVPLFLISLKAGGTGLNLTAADTVIHYDPWWNPAVENQATDRAHRIGQSKQVFVYKLIAAGTVEEKIVAMQARKKALVAGLLDDQQAEKLHLTAEDLEVLFAPID